MVLAPSLATMEPVVRVVEMGLLIMSPQVRTFDKVDLTTLNYRKLDGTNRVFPAEDLSGQEFVEEAEA